MRKKIIAAILALTVMTTTLVGCSRDEMEDMENKVEDLVLGEDDEDTSLEGEVYFLNFKPEVDDKWQEIASLYTEETGVPVRVVTAASGTYEQTLKSEIAKTQAPTLFQVNGPIGYKSWADYCVDLSGTDLYSWLLDEEMAIRGEDGGVYGIPYLVEGYGIIYNESILDAYFAMEGAVVGSVEEITSYDTFKAVVEDMTAKKEELHIEGVFASTSLTPGEDWRWHTHLANIPISREYADGEVNDMDAIEFTYSDHYKNVFDLYINNSPTAPSMLGSKSVSDSMAEFALGQVAMVQNGNWGWSQISGVDGNVVQEEDVKFLPIYAGMEGEENQGLSIGTENFFCVNGQTSEANQAATIAFLEWLYGTDAGKDAVTNQLGFIVPFSTFSEEERPSDPLAKEVIRYMEDETKENVPWHFTTFPSISFKDDFGASLLEYSAGSKEWEDVVSGVKESWQSEKNMVE